MRSKKNSLDRSPAVHVRRPRLDHESNATGLDRNEVPLAPRTARAIDLVVGERTEGPILLGPHGQRLDRHGASRIVRRIARHADICKRVGPHTLRHAFITAALDAGVPLRDVQEAASHADPRTTSATTGPGSHSTDTPPTSCPPSSPAHPANSTRPLRTRQNERGAGMRR